MFALSLSVFAFHLKLNHINIPLPCRITKNQISQLLRTFQFFYLFKLNIFLHCWGGRYHNFRVTGCHSCAHNYWTLHTSGLCCTKRHFPLWGISSVTYIYVGLSNTNLKQTIVCSYQNLYQCTCGGWDPTEFYRVAHIISSSSWRKQCAQSCECRLACKVVTFFFRIRKCR